MPEKPADYDTMSEQQKKKEDKSYEDALCYKYYEVQTAKMNPLHYAAITHKYTRSLPCIKLVKSVCGGWSSEGAFRLRSSLLAMVDHWDEINPNNTNCPISFTEEERNLHNEEMENRDYIDQVMENFQEAGLLPADGIVEPQDYETIKKTSVVLKERLLSMADTEEEKTWLDRLWPYQDSSEGT